MRGRLLGFVELLRARGLRVGVGECVDAMEAAAAVGVERDALREALAATLVKDEALREEFDDAFDAWFPSRPRGAARAGDGGAGGEGVAGGGGRGGSAAGSGAPERREEPESESDGERRGAPRAMPRPDARGSRPRAGDPAAGGAGRTGRQARVDLRDLRERAGRAGRGADDAPSAARALARERLLARTPFRDMDPTRVPELRDLAAALARRFERRWSRRDRRARSGRVDLRRTVRLALRTGGVPVRILHRRRRPSRPDLVALVDLSWSTATAAELLLSLLAPARRHFRRVALLAYVDDLVEISFEHGLVVPHAAIDVGARSDFGRVLQRLVERRDLRRDTVVLVLGDARNNRLPPRVELLRDVAARVRALAWLTPDPPARWDTGDSVIGLYARHVDLLLEAHDLASLAASLDRVVGRAGAPRRRRPARRPPIAVA